MVTLTQCLAWHGGMARVLDCYRVLLWSSDRPLAGVPDRRLLWDWGHGNSLHTSLKWQPQPRTILSACINDQPKECVAYRHSTSSLLYYHIMVLKSDSVFFFFLFCENESASGLTTRKQRPKFLLHVLYHGTTQCSQPLYLYNLSIDPSVRRPGPNKKTTLTLLINLD